MSSDVIIEMEDCKTRITNPKVSDAGGDGNSSRELLKVREFTYDHSFWSVDARDDHYVTQTQVLAFLRFR